jgi:hypothetical protein
MLRVDQGGQLVLACMALGAMVALLALWMFGW